MLNLHKAEENYFLLEGDCSCIYLRKTVSNYKKTRVKIEFRKGIPLQILVVVVVVHKSKLLSDPLF